MSNVNPLKCVSSKTRNFYSDETASFPFIIKTSKYSGICNNINDPYAELCVADVAKNINLKIFNLISENNQTRQIKWHETSKCKCRINENVGNNKQRWNIDNLWM